MTYENIRFNQRNMVFHGGYFYCFDYERDSLLQKIDDGTISFTYPLDNTLATDVLATHTDGVNFWTMQDAGGGVVIKRWRIDNFICKLKQTINCTSATMDSVWSDEFNAEYIDVSNSTYSHYTDAIYKYPDANIMSNNSTVVTISPPNGYIQRFTYVSIDLGGGNEKIVKRLRYYMYNHNVTDSLYNSGSAKFQGSNDSTDGTDGSWDDLADIPALYVYDESWSNYISVDNDTAYRWYRIYGTKSDNSMVGVEWELLECDTDDVKLWNFVTPGTSSSRGALLQEDGCIYVLGYDDIANWSGPTMYADLSTMSNFSVILSFNVFYTDSATVWNYGVYLSDGASSSPVFIRLWKEIGWASPKISVQSPLNIEKYSGDVTINTDSSNTLVIDRAGAVLRVTLNDTIEYDGACDSTTIDRICILYQRYYGYPEPTEFCTNFVAFGNNIIDSDTFSLEHYSTTLSQDLSGSFVSLNSHYDAVVSGTIMTLGPNIDGNYEDVVVVSVSGTVVTLTSGTLYNFSSGDYVNFYNNFWVFNDYYGLDNTGALYKVNAHDGSFIEAISNSDYKDVTASTFSIVDDGGFSSNTGGLIYNKNTILKIRDVLDLDSVATMPMDNETSGGVVIPIYAMSIENDTLYRMQKKACYYDVDVDWGSQYNYQISTLRSFVDSITAAAYPAVLPANGVNTSEISISVLDQYGEGPIYKPVVITDDDSIGFITINPAYTDQFFGTGEAKSYYKAGTSARTVTIICTATQYD